MTDNDKSDETNKLRLARPGRLELKKTVEAGKVQQSFSHGRSKSVMVEVRKKRTFAPGAGGTMTEVKQEAEAQAQAAAAAGFTSADLLPTLTSAEKAARAKALQEAIRVEEEARHHHPDDVPAGEETEADAAETPTAIDIEATPAAEIDVPLEPSPSPAIASARPATPRSGAEARPARPKPAGQIPPRIAEAATEDDGPARSRRGAERTDDARRAPAAPRRGEPRRRSGRMTVAQALADLEERTRSLAAVRRAREKEKQKAHSSSSESQGKIVREVIIPETITVQELANRMAERGAAVIKALMKMGVMATINQAIDPDTAELVAAEFGHKIKRVSDSDIELGLGGGQDDEASLQSRPPVVTVMGHVDHGKTSLLDALRETDVVSGEAGGITQHIGAYQVTLKSGAKITFIDTPGHEAFTAMRARGASVTDIVILVVAADDGIMPQTVEAIRHAKAAKVPIIVAINKMDKPGANPARIRQDLLQHELVVEDMGGDILAVEISAKKRMNLEKLEEAILLQAEILDLKANPNRFAEGVIVEARMEQGRGAVATVLIQKGTLRVGDIFVGGSEWGRVRALVDDHGRPIKEAGPAAPVEVLGFNATPTAGDDLVVVNDEGRAREVAEFRQRKDRHARAVATGRGTLEQMFSKIKEGSAKELPILVKGDVQGSVEAISGTLDKISTDEVKVRILHTAVGAINESDVTLARASGALIVGFNVRANPQAREMAKRDGIEIRYYSIIYNLAEDIKTALSGLLAPTMRENFLGYAEIREVFNITKVGKVAGCRVTEGVVKRGAKVRLLRDNVVVHEGALSTLKHFKDDVREVKQGMECGMSFETYSDIQAGDVIECFEVEEVARAL